MKLKMNGERHRYTVQAYDERWIVMTKPFNLQGTYLYSIVDLERKVRGPCNLIFGPPFELDNEKGGKYMLKQLRWGVVEVSHRRWKYKALDPDELERCLEMIKTPTVMGNGGGSRHSQAT